MAITPIIVAWMSKLTSRGVLQGGAMLEMGPSDLILYTPAAIEFYIRRHMPADGVRSVMDKLFDSQGVFRRDEIGTLYSTLGYTQYRSIDLADSRADWRFDLNHPIDIPDRFDTITNFGTAEHIFDIAQVFRSMHVLLKEGGVQIHGMPAYGDVNHGFYNIHPTLYFDVASANGYVIEDFLYLDEVNRRTMEHTDRFEEDYDFDTLPIGRAELEAHASLGTLIDRNFIAIQKQRPDAVPRDYAFVAMRKVLDQPFRTPVQRLYAT